MHSVDRFLGFHPGEREVFPLPNEPHVSFSAKNLEKSGEARYVVYLMQEKTFDPYILSEVPQDVLSRVIAKKETVVEQQVTLSEKKRLLALFEEAHRLLKKESKEPGKEEKGPDLAIPVPRKSPSPVSEAMVQERKSAPIDMIEQKRIHDVTAWEGGIASFQKVK
jgi:hypothetical protein